ncbi:legumain-like [Penaeus monodon]|uniref:legumain-like n=1 Tax=Penaeus monodon TaxID=6687 RepID=UPI0018A76CAD|nr:legumain-like [Penaeus monodon]XP_037786229.1 legumain-like [Penaeus monodon]
MKWLALLAAAAVVALSGAQGDSDGEGELWAVLVAGSNTWFNYRHQADVCHAYQILHEHGVPDDHIIVMMSDDIAHNSMNPTPGVVINRPDGPNVYKGVPKDYTGDDVTPENFLKVLSGDAAGLQGVGSGKVLKSGPNDRVFINLVDHGAPGIFAFPRTFLMVKNFTNAIVQMHRQKRYKEMLIYMESCESGSMFLNLPDDIKMYALSAANATQSSYACYMDQKLGTFLGDVFSIKWMEDTDREDVNKETLKKQFEIVHKETTTSDVLQWGELSLDKHTVGTFVGSGSADLDDYGPFPTESDPCLKSAVPSPDVPLAILEDHVAQSDGLLGADFWKRQLAELQQNRTFVTDTMRKIAQLVTGDDNLADKMMSDVHAIADDACHEESVLAFHYLCFNLGTNPYALRVVQTMVNLCEHGYSAKEFTGAARAVCTHPPVSGIN